jgi:lipopolysaccharide biosynthesis glycosyltransferase
LPLPRDGLKWYCAVAAKTLDFVDSDLRNLIRVAVFSALRNTRLRPHVIYDGADDWFTAELRCMGAKVIFRRSALFDALEQHAGQFHNWLHVMSGAFLRFEVPVVETQEQFALYTDCDVLFLRDPYFGRDLPEMFAATSQFSTDPAEDMNSGVMLINVPNMRRILPDLLDFSRRSLHLGLDQEILRAYFQANYLPLDRSLNWKPYWGWGAGAQNVHFHGPKPAAARKYLMHGELPKDTVWAGLLGQSREGYEAYTRLYYLYFEAMHAGAAQLTP